ncbi:hypothetical protein BDR07DRAFT_1545883, partial [Suillus spraguei]
KPGQSSGNRTLSWIWKAHGIASDAPEGETILLALRIEWCKSRARAMRWVEEVQLLQEEMRRSRHTSCGMLCGGMRKQIVAQGSCLRRLKVSEDMQSIRQPCGGISMIHSLQSG